MFSSYFNGGLHAVSIGKPSERMSNFWTVNFLKNLIWTEFQFSAHPYMQHNRLKYSNAANCVSAR